MTDETPDEERLDADQVPCRKCGAQIGAVCRQPDGSKARSVHVLRRRDAAAGGPPAEPAPVPRGTRRRKAEGSATFDSETAKAAAKKSAQERRRRRNELAAQIEQAQEEAQAEAIHREAVALAEDASRYARDRALLRRHVLDAAAKATDQLVDAIDHLKRPAGYDEDGRIKTRTVELYAVERGRRVRVEDHDGKPAVDEVPDVIGFWSADSVEKLAKIATSTLNALRLEEGKPTGIEGKVDLTDDLDGIDVDELARIARGDK